ncbi:MAG: hypothetical protein JOZ19_05305 [Rubrobacter sp.]|nr:hypothetical protein [Rubrobacter sp.]
MAEPEYELLELAYDLRDDGVLYELGDGMRVKVRQNSKNRVRVSMQRGNVFVPPETGDLGTGTFRSRLVDLARERFDEVNGLAEELGTIAVGFEEHLKEREEAAATDDEESNAPELVGTPYRIVDGGFVHLKSTPNGEIPQHLTNFVARVEEEMVKDDGADMRRYYRVVGEVQGRRLPPADVPAPRFASMGWVAEEWGLKAHMTAGLSVKDCVREAIELLSQEARTRHVYQHVGFTTLPDGKRVYLHGGGAVGVEQGVEVELEGELSRYALPNLVDAVCLPDAIRRSLRIVDIAPDRVTFLLLASVYLAPLSGIVSPDFVVWLWAATGNLKSTLASLALSHYGDFTEDTLPISFESTPNFIERILFCSRTPSP